MGESDGLLAILAMVENDLENETENIIQLEGPMFAIFVAVAMTYRPMRSIVTLIRWALFRDTEEDRMIAEQLLKKLKDDIEFADALDRSEWGCCSSEMSYRLFWMRNEARVFGLDDL